MKIAVAQIKSNIFSLNENFQSHKNIIESICNKEKIDMFCFPEASLTGYSVEFGEKIGLREEEKNSYINKFKDISNKFNCLVLFGLIEMIGNQYFISHYSVSNEGVYFYRKIHLGKKERKFFSEGKTVDVFSYGDVNYGIQLCYDLHFPELTTIQRIKGADIIFAPHAVSKKSGNRKKIWDKYVCARAYDNSLVVVCCNQISNEKKEFGGGMTLFSKNGEVLEEFYEDQEKVLIFEYKKEQLKSSKKNFISNRKPEYYKEILGGI